MYAIAGTSRHGDQRNLAESEWWIRAPPDFIPDFTPKDSIDFDGVSLYRAQDPASYNISRPLDDICGHIYTQRYNIENIAQHYMASCSIPSDKITCTHTHAHHYGYVIYIYTLFLYNHIYLGMCTFLYNHIFNIFRYIYIYDVIYSHHIYACIYIYIYI